MKRLLSLIASASVAFATVMGGTAIARPSPSQKCASAKQKAAGKKSACKLACTAKAAAKGLALTDATITACLDKCTTKFSTAFTKAEAKGGCHTTGDAAAIEGRVDEFVADIAGRLPAEGSVSSCIQPFRSIGSDLVDAFLFGLDPSGNLDVPASCGASTPVCCPGGNPVSPCGPLQFDFMPSVGESPAILVPQLDPDSFTFDVPARLKTTTDIPVAIPGVGDCAIQVDTAPGPSPRINISGTVTFTGDRLRMGPVASVTLTGLTTDDVALHGGVSCQLANLGISFFAETLADLIQNNLGAFDALCRACCTNDITHCGP